MIFFYLKINKYYNNKMEEEIWKLISDNYYISNYGNIKKIGRNNKIIILKKRKRDNNPYEYINIKISEGNISKKYFIYKLVAEKFIPNPKNRRFIKHINNNIYDNNYKNLFWYDIDNNLFNKNKFEKYKQIKDYPNYYISNYGNIKYIVWEKITDLEPYINKEGYKYIRAQDYILNKDNILYIHELVAKYFININLKLYIDKIKHFNNIITNNHYLNLIFDYYPNEEWKEIKENNKFSISNYGRVKTINNNFIKQDIHINGFYFVILEIGKQKRQRKSYYVHKLVAEYFIKNPKNKLLIKHLDNNLANNYYKNLLWYNIDNNLFNINKFEKYKQIKNFPNYYISNHGNVKVIIDEKELILQKNINTNGYFNINAYKGLIHNTLIIHQLVAKYFVKNPDPINKNMVDHINRIPTINHYINLRWVTHKENNYNRSLPINNTSGYKGIHLTKSNKWRAKITVDLKSIDLGCYDTKEEAAKAYLEAKKKYHVIK
jgi:hypothetical protein